MLQPERFLWHPTDISPAFVSWESNSTQQMGNRAVFQEVTVTASHANPSPAGTCTACELHSGSREELSLHSQWQEIRRSIRRGGLGGLPSQTNQSDRSAFLLGEREGEVSVITEGTEKRGVCWGFLFLCTFFWASWRGWSLLWRPKCREQEKVRA